MLFPFIHYITYFIYIRDDLKKINQNTLNKNLAIKQRFNL